MTPRPSIDARHPKRSLGQNFLVDPRIADRIVAAVPIEPDDVTVEIGPGRGALTGRLLERASRLVVIELDDALAAHWEERAAQDPRLDVVHADALTVPLAGIADPDRLIVVGNIPYNITTPLLFHVLSRPRPRAVVVMVQREVADRIRAASGSKTYGALSVGVQAVADVERVLDVPAGAFRPRPNVESTVLRITPHRPPRLSAREEVGLRVLVRAAFQWRRKQMVKVLREHPDLALGAAASHVLDAVGLPPEARPDQVEPGRWVALVRALLEQDEPWGVTFRRALDRDLQSPASST
ncbi:MAG: 16S rRNA (adenine(1518)-N(6)/adenine(1519)-N(6))-dimethyltransferase RsmA [Gemmatimonadota bacterium]